MVTSNLTAEKRNRRETEARQGTTGIRMAKPGEAGDLAEPIAPVHDNGTSCPFCGGTIQRYEIQDSGGERAASLCCGIPQEFLDNYDVFSALPEPLQQIAIARKQEEYAAMETKSREDARKFRECVERYAPRMEQLTKEVRHGY